MACIGVLLTQEKGSQPQRTGAAREQEDTLSEALFYRGEAATSTTAVNTRASVLGPVRGLGYRAREIHAVIERI